MLIIAKFISYPALIFFIVLALIYKKKWLFKQMNFSRKSWKSWFVKRITVIQTIPSSEVLGSLTEYRKGMQQTERRT